jgi:hypothetical protein
MLTGIVMLVADEVLHIARSDWTRCAALLTLFGAAAELTAVWRFTRQR